MTRTSLVVVGDTLLDVDVDGRVDRLCPEAPVPVLDEETVRVRAGGAGLAAVLAAGDGHRVALVTALAPDEGGRTLVALLAAAGVDVVDLGLAGDTPRKQRLRADGRLLLRLDTGGAAGVVGPLPAAARGRIAACDAVLVSDYGRGVVADAGMRALLDDAAARRPVVWDPHPRGPDPVEGVRLVTPSRSEAEARVPDVAGDDLKAASARARVLAQRWGAPVAVTLGSEGAVLATGDAKTFLAPAPDVAARDVCGAGDRFAAAAAGELAGGALAQEAVVEAVRSASEFVAAGGAAAMCSPAPVGAPLERADTAQDVVARVRSAGGTVVMTGGCFDLVHAGHVRTLEAARELGDCLVVCLNSDESVRRLKGEDRPIVPQADRAAVLRALACVDAVVIFDESTPETVLERFRPDIWAKGGDYALDDLPERRVVERWGGHVVVLPYVEGRSTTRLLEELVLRDIR